MRKSKFSESTIVTLLKEAEAGRKVADICREHGISTATFYQWRSKLARRMLCGHEATVGDVK
jgi:putative transposase